MSAALVPIEAIDPHVVRLDEATQPPARAALDDTSERVVTGYAGASRTRRALREWNPAASGPNTDTLPDLPALRARSRDANRNIPLATGGLNTIATTTIGTGLVPHPRIDRVLLGLTKEEAAAWQSRAERLWWAFAGSRACDIARQLPFGQMQDVALMTALESGDVLLVRRYKKRPGDLFGLKVQLVEADRISNPQRAMDTDRLKGGVELDEDGAPVRYHVLDRHPGEWIGIGRRDFTWKVVPAVGAASGEPIAHLVARIRRTGQVRGVPVLAPVLEALKQLGRYTDAELMAAVVSAFYTVFIKTQDGGEGEDDPTGAGGVHAADVDPINYKLGHGSVVGLLPGEDISTATPGRPNAGFDPFVLAIIRQIGVALELPYEFMIKHFTASYSASQAALLEAWRAVMTRRGWFADSFCQPVYEWFLSEAIERGYLDAPGYFDDPLARYAWSQCDWRGPARGQINPVQEVTAAQMRVDAGFSTITQETAQLTGGDWEENHEQQVHERRMRERDGLTGEGVAERIITEPVQPVPAPDAPDQQDEAEQQDATGSTASARATSVSRRTVRRVVAAETARALAGTLDEEES